MRRRPHPHFWPRDGVMFEGFPIARDDVVIDVGCGDGKRILECAKTGAKVIATDIRPDAIEIVSGQLSAIGADFEAFVSDAAPLPLADESATRVISTQVIEHVDDPYAFLAELVRIGRPGALYFLSAPDAAGDHLVKRIAHPSAFEKPHHIRIIQRGEFGDMVTQTGLIIERRAIINFADLMSWLLLWVDEDAKSQQLRAQWHALWNDVLDAPGGARLEAILDEALPKDQIIVARKP